MLEQLINQVHNICISLIEEMGRLVPWIFFTLNKLCFYRMVVDPSLELKHQLY